jgi:hypothetical protein
MANLLTVQTQRGIGPRYTLSDGFTEVDGELSFAYFTRATTTPANSTDLGGVPYTANVANGDVIYAAKLPKGARILFGRLFHTALGAGVTLQVGVPGTANKFLASFDASAAGASELAATFALGAGEVLTAETWLIITVGGANPAAGQTISGFIAYAAH